MDKSKVIALFTQDQRIDVSFPDVRREATEHVVRLVSLSDIGDGMIVYSNLTGANANDVIREQISYFESIGQGFEWKLYDYDQPANLKDRLEAHGFEIEEAETVVVLDLEEAPEKLWQPVRHDVRRITDPAKLVDIETIEETVWNEDSSWVHDYLGEALKNYPDQMSIYVAYVDGKPASAAWVYFSEGSPFASLWGGSTISEYRKQGLYTALLSVRAQEAKARQVRYLTVDASDMSRPILEKFGFERLAITYPCNWQHKP